LAAAGGVPNYFGPQRFGTLRATTHLVGRHLVFGRFRDAIDTYLMASAFDEEPALQQARAAYAADRDAAAMLRRVEGLEADFESALLNGLITSPDDPVRAFRALPSNLQTLCVYAYQSFLFNRILSRRLAQGLPLAEPVAGDLVVPLEEGNPTHEFLAVSAENLDRVRRETARGRLAVTGLLCGTEAPLAEGEMGSIERAVIQEEGVEPRLFLIPEHLPLSSKGTRRPLALRAPAMTWNVGPDDREPGRTMAEASFELPKGAYATVLLREYLKLDDVRAYG
jgi:tRNA pseudouridine13 synthase